MFCRVRVTVWLVLGCSGVRRGRGEACRQAGRHVPGPRQFRRPLHPQSQLPFTRLHAPHSHRTLQRFTFYPIIICFNPFYLSVPKIIQGFGARLANRPFLVLSFGHSVWRSTLSASLASNPSVTVPILELWAKWVNSFHGRVKCHFLQFTAPMKFIGNFCACYWFSRTNITPTWLYMVLASECRR